MESALRAALEASEARRLPSGPLGASWRVAARAALITRAVPGLVTVRVLVDEGVDPGFAEGGGTLRSGILRASLIGQ